MITKKKSVRDSVKDALKDLGSVGFKPDAEFDPNDLGSTLFVKKSQGEIIRDRLIESCRNADGWYIGLDKDIGGNEWQFKDKITSYDHWTNLRFEITEWVREKSKLEMQRTGRVLNYGSGRYRVIFYNVNGNRDSQEPVIIPVDAQEYMLEVPKTLTGSGGADVNEILRTVQATQVPPSDIVKMQIEATQKGMEIAASKEAKQDNTTNLVMQSMFAMMGNIIAAVVGKPAAAPVGPDPMQMMTQFFGMAKDFGAFKTGSSMPQKSYMDMIQELRAAGIKVGNDSDDIATQISKIKSMIDIFRPLVGSGEGEPAPLWERIVERHGDKLIDLLGGLVKMNNGNGMPKPNIMVRQPRTAPRIAPRTQPEPVAQSVEMEGDPYNEPVPVAQDIQSQEKTVNQEEQAEMFALVTKFAAELKDAVINDRTDKFNYITETVSKFTKDADFNIKVGVVTAEVIIKKILMLDGDTYADPVMRQKLVSYVDRYIEFVRSQGSYYAQCSKCHDFGEFQGGKAEFESEEDKTCGQDFRTGKCDGVLQAMY